MDIQLEWPELLFFIPVLFVAAILIGWSELRTIRKYVSQKRYAAKYALCFLFASLLVIGASGPYWPSGEKSVVLGSGKCMFLFDESWSMSVREDSREISRLERSKKMASELSRTLQGCEKAVYGFTSKVASHASLGSEDDFIDRTITHIVKIEAVGGSGSFLTNGIGGIVLDAFRDVPGETPKTVFLWSDGGEELSSYYVEELRKELWKAKDIHIRFVVIGMGKKEGTLLTIEHGQSIVAVLNEETLELIAEETDGIYFPEGEWQGGMKNNEIFLASAVGLNVIEYTQQGKNPLAPYVLLGSFVAGLILFAKFR